jgi:hypothetical protein
MKTAKSGLRANENKNSGCIVQHVIAEVPAIAKIKALLKRRAFK